MVSTVITKANGTDRVIDFRDKLSRAQVDNYGTMHQTGGKNKDGLKTYPSVIEMVICDYSKGTGDKSVTVSLNLEPSIPFEWYEVCKANLGTTVLPLRHRVPQQGAKEWETWKTDLVENRLAVLKRDVETTANTARGAGTLFGNIRALVRRIVKKEVTVNDNDFWMTIGTSIRTAADLSVTPSTEETEISFIRGVNYEYTQDKVNVYKKSDDGYAPVSRLTVTRASFRKDGDASNYPWMLKITNGEALVEEKDTGATTFKSNTMRNKSEAYILVSDRDMFRSATCSSTGL